MKAARVSLSKPSSAIWKVTLLCGVLAAVLFSLWPELDIYTSSWFYEGNNRFFLQNNPLGTIPRKIFQIFFGAFCVLAIIGLLFTLIRRTPLLRLDHMHWAYLVACLIIGPGLVANSILKENWGRARPVDVVQFGSTKTFTPALVPSTACKRNCSFVSGESSSIYMLFFSLALLLATYRRRMIIGGLIVGGLAGLMRMGMGGHFLSDVTFSGIFMMAIASGLYWLFFTRTDSKT